MFLALDRLKPWLEQRAAKAAPPAEAKPIGPATRAGPGGLGRRRSARRRTGRRRTTTLTGHTILIGYGRVGSLVGAALKAGGAALPGHRGRRQDAGQAAEATASRPSPATPPMPRCFAAANPPARQAADPRHPQRLRGRPDRAAGPRRQPRHRHHRPRPFRCRGRASEGARRRHRDHGRTRDRPRHRRRSAGAKANAAPEAIEPSPA